MKLRTYQFVVQVTVNERDEEIIERSGLLEGGVATFIRHEIQSNLEGLDYVHDVVVTRGVVAQ